MPPFLNGLLFGLIFIFSFGPGFFALIQTSITRGIKPALYTAAGISLSDAFYVSLVLLGIANYLEDSEVRLWMGIIGLIVIVTYAIYSWFKKPKIYTQSDLVETKINSLKFFAKGFLLNGLNPFILIFWIGIISVVTVNYEYSIDQQKYFFGGVLSTIIIMDTIKVLLANRLKHLITPSIILVLNRSVGVILLLFGLRIFYFLFDNYWI